MARRKHREPFSNPTVESSVRRMDDVFGSALDQIAKELRAELAQLERDGSLMQTSAANIARVRALAAKLEQRLGKLGWSKATKLQAKELKALAASVLKEAKVAELPNRFTATTGKAIDAIMWNAHREILGDQALVAQQLEQLVVRSVMGGHKWTDVVSNLQVLTGKSKRQMQTKAAGVLSNFHTTTRVQHFGAPDPETGRPLVKWWGYDGPLDGRTRPFCLHCVKMRFTIPGLNALAPAYGREHPLPPAMSLGGWGPCRHELIPLVTEKAIAAWEKGPRRGVA